MMKRIWIFTAILAFSTLAFGQSIKFEKTTHDFGKMEKGDLAEHTFTFTNTTDADLKLSRVKASCGCTTPSWTNTAVAPGATGEIKVKYNTSRIGPFTKTVTVTVNEAERPTILYIKGAVNTPLANSDVNFPNKIGNLGFDKITQNVGVLDSDKEKTMIYKVKNLGPKPINFLKDMDKEIMFDVDVMPPALTPGAVGTITVKVHGEKFISFGAFDKAITLYTNDEKVNAKNLKMTGNINRVFTEEELAEMPNIKFDMTDYKGGTVLEGEKVEVAYAFTNTGKEDLIIESVKASCGCTATAPKDKIVKAGETSEILATFNSRGRKGKQSKSITVRTNDPDNPTVVLRLSVEVEQDPFHQNNMGPSVPR
ncbi:MAG: DUF1573 domain-containing protein [Bacteroidota bacterium]